MAPSHPRPSQSSPPMIAATASGVDRTRSVSSMRSRNLPPWCRANSQLKSAVRAPPMCRNPVGEGAKRTTTLILRGWVWVSVISTLGQGVVTEHLAQADLHNLSGRGVRQFIEHHYVVGQHPARKALGEKFEQVIALRPTIGSRRHDQQRPLGPALMRDSDHCGFRYIGMRDGGVFEVDRADPFATGFDDVL